MTYTIDLPTDLTEALRDEAISIGVPETDLVRTILRRHFDQVAMMSREAANSRPTVPPAWLLALQSTGSANSQESGMHRVYGAWPGEESDEEIKAWLEHIS